MKFIVNKPRVIAQLLDGEVIIINFNTCFYYSLTRSAADIWIILEKNASLAEIVEGVAKSYEGSRSKIEEAVQKFVAQLEDQGLIIQSDEAVNCGFESVSVNKKGEFTDPLMQKYSDMQEMLLIDPVHEVDDSGWPNVKTNT